MLIIVVNAVCFFGSPMDLANKYEKYVKITNKIVFDFDPSRSDSHVTIAKTLHKTF